MNVRETVLQTKTNRAALFYTGQMGFLLKHGGVCLMVDGYLSDYVDRNCCSERVRWRRRYAPPMSPEELDFVDFVFCTHAHYDHTDPYTLAGLAKVNPRARVFAPPPAVPVIAGAGIDPERITEVKPGGPYALTEDCSFTVFPAAHEELHPLPGGAFAEVGYRFRLGGVCVAHTGDCCPYPGLAEHVAGVDALIAPINGRDEYRTRVLDIIGCFSGEEALALASESGAGLLIPGHYDLYDVNGADPAAFLELGRARFPRQTVKLFAPGEAYIL